MSDTIGVCPGFFKLNRSLYSQYALHLVTSAYLVFLSLYLYFTGNEAIDDDTFSVIPLLSGIVVSLSVLGLIQDGFTIKKMSSVEELSYERNSPGREGWMNLKFRETASALVLVSVAILFSYGDAVGGAVCPSLKNSSAVSQYDYLSWANQTAGCPDEICTKSCQSGTQMKDFILILIGFIAALLQRLLTMGISVENVLTENCPEDDIGFIRAYSGSDKTYTIRKFSILLLLFLVMGSNIFTIMDNNQKLDISEVSYKIKNEDYKDSHHLVFVFVIVLNTLHTFLALLGVILTGTKRKGEQDKMRDNCVKVFSCGMGGNRDECPDAKPKNSELTYEKFYVFNQIPFIRFLVVNSTIVLLSVMIGQSIVFDLDIQYPSVSLVLMLLADGVANHDF